jgi:hypothetical protein
MNKILDKNSDGSIDVLDARGIVLYRVDREEVGIVALLVRKLFDYENAFTEENIKLVLDKYFDIGNDSYAYNLTRDKSAFGVGTISLDDFEEFDEEITTDIAEYLMKNAL